MMTSNSPSSSVIATALILVIALSVSLASGGANPPKIKGVSFQDSISGALYYQTASLSWISSHTYILQEKNQLKEVAVDADSEKVLVKNISALNPDHGTSYYFSVDKQFVLYTTLVKPIYRHTQRSVYTILDVKKNKQIHLKPSAASPNATLLQYASWCPVGSSLAFVHDNDIYHVSDPTAKPVRLTTDGEPGVIFNGVPDWVYEEEVFGTDNALYWSPSGTRLAFIQFNDTLVPKYQFPNYGSSRDAYTTADVFRYPKAGFTNPTIKLFVRDVSASPSTSSNIELLPPAGHGLGDDYLIGNVKFRDDDALLVIWTNRVQNESVISLCDVAGANPACHLNLRDNEPGGWSWVMPTKGLFLAEDGSKYFLVLPQVVGDDSFPHIAMVTTPADITTTGKKSFLTSGKKEIDSLLAIRLYVDSKPARHQIFYISTLDGDSEGEAGARQRHLFVVDSAPDSVEKCLSCEPAVGGGCKYFTASAFENSQKAVEEDVYFVLTCRGDDLLYGEGKVAPFTALVRYSTLAGETKVVRMLEKNKGFAEKMAKYDWPAKKFFEAPIETSDDADDDGLIIRGQVFLPPDFESKKKEKHPILFNIYSGPSTTKVKDQFVVDWHSYMATQKGFVIVNIDGRGSSMRGNNLRFSMYRRLGGPEIEDVIVAAKYLLNKSEWKDKLDEDRVGVWGWSYGGYATSHVLGRGSDVFTCGAAVAPVTSWIFYDSIYTERYMSTPSDNPSGYDGTRVMDSKRVENFRKANYLLIHGTADDNVHFQNSMHLTTALIKKEIPFETQVYPDKNHAISGSNYRTHLYNKLTDFFINKCKRKAASSTRFKRSALEEEEQEEEEEAVDGRNFRRDFVRNPTCFSKDMDDCL